MTELLILTIFYGMLIASIAAYTFYFYGIATAPDHRGPAGPFITLVLAILLVFVANVDPPLPRDGLLSRIGAALILAWLGWTLWRRT